MRTIALLTISNIFMTFAWNGHLKYRNVPLFEAIVVGWLIAFFEIVFRCRRTVSVRTNSVARSVPITQSFPLSSESQSARRDKAHVVQHHAA